MTVRSSVVKLGQEIESVARIHLIDVLV